jgi:hypothetical protein
MPKILGRMSDLFSFVPRKKTNVGLEISTLAECMVWLCPWNSYVETYLQYYKSIKRRLLGLKLLFCEWNSALIKEATTQQLAFYDLLLFCHVNTEGPHHIYLDASPFILVFLVSRTVRNKFLWMVQCLVICYSMIEPWHTPNLAFTSWWSWSHWKKEWSRFQFRCEQASHSAGKICALPIKTAELWEGSCRA